MFGEGKVSVVGGEDGGSINFPCDLEIEWIGSVFECHSCEVNWVCELRQWIDWPWIALRDFIS